MVHTGTRSLRALPGRSTRRPGREGCTIGRVRKLLKWIVVTVGIAALVHWFRRRGAEQEVTAPSETEDDPADELRRKLAESRGADTPEGAETPEASVEERRTDVHEQGRAALDEMTPSDED